MTGQSSIIHGWYLFGWLTNTGLFDTQRMAGEIQMCECRVLIENAMVRWQLTEQDDGE